MDGSRFHHDNDICPFGTAIQRDPYIVVTKYVLAQMTTWATAQRGWLQRRRFLPRPSACRIISWEQGREKGSRWLHEPEDVAVLWEYEV